MTARPPLDVAREVAEEVGAFCLSNWGHVDPADIEAKAPRDFVSTVDRKAEDIARDRLLHYYPDIPVVGEERGGKAEGTFWIVDPLDGTSNFLSGLPLWCVSIGLVREGVPVLGAIVAPALKFSVSATTQGSGDVTTISPFPGGFNRCIAVGRNPGSSRARRETREVDLEEAGFTLVNLGSCALSLAFVATGRLGGYVEFGTRLWDCAAGAAICKAAARPLRLGCIAEEFRIDIEAGFGVLD
ncbi:hypothetical protein FMN63_03710 [Stappia sp. BW2]|uniref:inositol monophosphatase family protein n=1 Tax=Stappia sp. BW2 TaxID=2592622 RepID=UPI0011DEFBE9|nr:inositol monophosphatase family protein [Stappia sp. BW2]TYC77979.1 hypothetical protein FMN63_03710 [Stappia sp. BW2]